MGKLSELKRANIMNYLLRGEGMDVSTPYIALFNGNPENGGVECSGSEYYRKPCFVWNEAENGKVVNIENVVFDKAETDDWGTINYVAVMDSDISTIPIAYDEVAPIAIEVGKMIYINEGDLEIEINLEGFTTGLCNNILNYIFNNYSPAITPYSVIGLSTTTIGDNGSFTEPEGDYLPITYGGWGESIDGETKNQSLISWIAEGWNIKSAFVLVVSFGMIYGSCNISLADNEILQFNPNSITLNLN